VALCLCLLFVTQALSNDSSRKQKYVLDESVIKSLAAFEGKSVTSVVIRSSPSILEYEGLENGTIPLHRSFAETFPALLDDLLQSVQEDSVDLDCEIELEDGQIFRGLVVQWTGPELVLAGEYGTFSIPLEKITELRRLVQTTSGVKVALRPDPNTTRLLFAPTARSLNRGEGYFSVYEVIMPSIQVGISDRVSLGGGLSPIFSSEFGMFWFTPKVGFVETEEYALAAGVLSVLMINPDDSGSLGVGYGVGTWGSPDRSFTVGLGWGYSDFDSSEVSSDPFLMLGGELRIGHSTKLITENWWPPGWDSPMLSLGVRWFAKRISADFALMRTADMDVFAVPWIDFIVNF
jgi:hypothetical protein